MASETWHLHGPEWEYRQAEGAEDREESGWDREAGEEGQRPRTSALARSTATQNIERLVTAVDTG